MRAPPRPFYEGLLESQWWSADKLKALQRRHLTSLLSHARASSPFYRYRLNRVFRPNGSIDWDQWSQIPIVSRADLSNNFDTMLSRTPVKAHGPFRDLTTSGSTGDPVTIRTTGWTAEMVAACNWRAQKWHDIDWSRPLLNFVSVDAPSLQAGDRTGPWGPPWDNVAANGAAVFLPKTTTVTEMFEAIRRQKNGYAAIPSPWVFQLCALNGASGSQAKGFLLRGGAVSREDRESAAMSFGSMLLELYSSKEAGPIAHPCPVNDGVLHVNDEAILLEIVDDAGQACAVGAAGRVVVTPLTSTALPLIRYDQGDVAIKGNNC
jgi:phenylacetate-CoA ligase